MNVCVHVFRQEKDSKAHINNWVAKNSTQAVKLT